MTQDITLGFKNIRERLQRWNIPNNCNKRSEKFLSISVTNMINLDFSENPVLNTRLQLILSNYKLLISNYILT